MTDPERLFKSGSADPAVRDLVASLREVAPAENAALNSWSTMAAKVAVLPSIVPAPLPASVAPVATGGVALSVLGAAGGKVAAAVAVAVLLGGTGYWYHAKQRAPAHVLSAVPSVSAPAVPLSAALPAPVATLETPVIPALPAPASSTPAAAFAGTPRSRLDAEASLVATVRRELQSGKPRAALGTLNQLQSQFPKGELGQERDVLMVEALAASGNTAAAKSKASAFIAAHPASPLSAKLERVIDAQ